MSVFLTVLGMIVLFVVLYFLVVALYPGFPVPEDTLDQGDRAVDEGSPTQTGSREDVSFEVGGVRINGWLYLPEKQSGPAPCVVMGQGFGGTREMLADSYALHFVEAGLAVLAFDYRHTGDSGGTPRQLIWIPYQLEDWKAAVAYAGNREEIDADRIGLWGTSLSGGHVIVIAAGDHRIACVSAQCPGLDGRASAEAWMAREGRGRALRLMLHGQRDLVRSWLGLSPHKIPIVGKPGSIAAMTTPDAYDFFSKQAPRGFINQVCARINLRGDKYRPVKHAAKVRCPVLLLICDKDGITPLSAAEEAEKKLGRYARVVHYPIDHFDIYTGPYFEKSVGEQVAFFKTHLSG